MNDVENKVENIDEELEDVSGGFASKDWSPAYKEMYEELGIKHIRHKLRKDEYYYNGEKITRKEARDKVNRVLNLAQSILND